MVALAALAPRASTILSFQPDLVIGASTADATAPPAPSIDSSSPPSPANDNSPELLGTAEADSIVTIAGSGEGRPGQIKVFNGRDLGVSRVFDAATSGLLSSVLADVPRPDVAALHGAQYANAGFQVAIAGLAPGIFDIVVLGHGSLSGTFNVQRVVRVIVTL